MHIQKTSLIQGGKAETEKHVKSQTVKTAPVQAKSSIPLSKSDPSVSSLISSLGLPADKLSASIVSFSRFFSLPLKPELMASIRHQSFTHIATKSPAQTLAGNSAAETSSESLRQDFAGKPSDSSVSVKNREALSLAAAAAESKGTDLQPKGLEAYAEAVDPDWQKRQDPGQKRRQQNKNQNEQNEENIQIKTDASSLKKAALESAENIPLLYLLNRLPGKNGQRWIVLPFNFSENGREYIVSMRILLETPGQMEVPGRVLLMALDIASCNEVSRAETGDTDKSWLFAMEAANNKVTRLSVFINPEPPSKAQLAIRRDFSQILGIPIELIYVKKRLDSFPCEGGCENGYQSIDEAV